MHRHYTPHSKKVFCPLVGREIPLAAWANLRGYSPSLQAWQEKVRLKLSRKTHQAPTKATLPTIIEEQHDPTPEFGSDTSQCEQRSNDQQLVVSQAADNIIESWLSDKYASLTATRCALHVLGSDHDSDSLNATKPYPSHARLLVVDPARWSFDLCDMGNDVWACMLLHAPGEIDSPYNMPWNWRSE